MFYQDESYQPFTLYGREWAASNRQRHPNPKTWDEMVDVLNLYHLPPYSLEDPLYLLNQVLDGKTFTVKQLQTFTHKYFTELTTRTLRPQRQEQLNIRTSDIDPFTFTTESLANGILNHVIYSYDGTKLSPVLVALATGTLQDVFIEMFDWIVYQYLPDQLVYFFQQIFLHSNSLWRLTDYEVEYLNLFPEWKDRFYNIMTHTRYTPRRISYPDGETISSFGVFLWSNPDVLDPYEDYWRHLSTTPELYRIYNQSGDAGEWLESTGVKIPMNTSIYTYIQRLSKEFKLLNQIVYAQKSVRKALPDIPNDLVYKYTDRELWDKYIPLFKEWTSLEDYRKQILLMK